MEDLRQAMMTTRGESERRSKRKRSSDKLISAADAYYMLLMNMI